MKYLPGIVTNVGWESTDKGVFIPFVTYRHEVIFDTTKLTGDALSMGLAIGF